MTPKEKAKELIDDMQNIIIDTYSIQYDNAKKCALVYCKGMQAERKRAVDIAYEFRQRHTESHAAKKMAGNDLAFVEYRISEECRNIGNAISGRTALSMNNSDYWELVAEEIKKL